MKKFIVALIVVFIAFFSFNANAQFTGGEVAKSSSETDLLAFWSNATGTKSLVFSHDSVLNGAPVNDMYAYVSIMHSPITSPEGTILSTTLMLSLGKTKEESISTLEAYRNLYNSMKKGEIREITDSFTNRTYQVHKHDDIKGLLFIGERILAEGLIDENNGYLTNKDIDKMLNKLAR